MQTQNIKLSPDFTGQNIYIGIDTHCKTWMVSFHSYLIKIMSALDENPGHKNYTDLLPA